MARIIGLRILSLVNGATQGKLGKVVHVPLVNCAMNDNKKNARSAAIEALQSSASLNTLDGVDPDNQALEVFIVAIIAELGGSELRAGGVHKALKLTRTHTDAVPTLERIWGESLVKNFAKLLVDCLLSPKSDVSRSAAKTLLQDCVKNGVPETEIVKKCSGHLTPAKQRSVGPILAKLF